MTAPPIACEASYPFDGSGVATEAQFYAMSRGWSRDGIDESIYGSGSGSLSVDSGAGTVTVAAYYAHVGGAIADQSTAVTIDMPAASASVRRDRIVTRREPGSDRCVVDVLEGTPGSDTFPALTRDPAGAWEYSHGIVRVEADGSLSLHTQGRVLLGAAGRRGLSVHRPPDTSAGELYYETDTGRTVRYDGSQWGVALEDTGWVNVPIRSFLGSTGGHPSVRRRDGLVTMRGGIELKDGSRFASGRETDVEMTLPTRFRPAGHLNVPVSTEWWDGLVTGRARIAPNGDVTFFVPHGPHWIAVDGISFEVG